MDGCPGKRWAARPFRGILRQAKNNVNRGQPSMTKILSFGVLTVSTSGLAKTLLPGLAQVHRCSDDVGAPE